MAELVSRYVGAIVHHLNHPIITPDATTYQLPTSDKVSKSRDTWWRILSADKMPAYVKKVQQIEAVAANLGRPLAEIAMRFCISNPHVSVTIPGIRTPEQARSNAIACEPLPADIVEALRQLA